MENQLQSKGDNGESENPETIAPNNYQLTNEEGTKTLDQVENKSEAEDDQEEGEEGKEGKEGENREEEDGEEDNDEEGGESEDSEENDSQLIEGATNDENSKDNSSNLRSSGLTQNDPYSIQKPKSSCYCCYYLLLIILLGVISTVVYLMINSIVLNHKIKEQNIIEQSEMIDKHYIGIIEKLNSSHNEQITNTTITYESIIKNITQLKDDLYDKAIQCEDELTNTQIELNELNTKLNIESILLEECKLDTKNALSNYSHCLTVFDQCQANQNNLELALKSSKENIEFQKQEYNRKVEMFYSCRFFGSTDEETLKQMHKELKNSNSLISQCLRSNSNLINILTNCSEHLTQEKQNSQVLTQQNKQEISKLNSKIEDQQKEINKPIINKLVESHGLETIITVISFISLGFFFHAYLL